MIRLDPMTDAEIQAFMAASQARYAEELSRANDLAPETAASQAEATFRRLVPDGRPSEDNQHLFTARDAEGQAVGSIWFGIRRDRQTPYAYIWDIFLAPEARGRGYGEQIMRQVEDQVRALGYTHIGLNVFGHNLPARKLYERLGFQAIAVSMGKDL